MTDKTCKNCYYKNNIKTDNTCGFCKDYNTWKPRIEKSTNKLYDEHELDFYILVSSLNYFGC